MTNLVFCTCVTLVTLGVLFWPMATFGYTFARASKGMLLQSKWCGGLQPHLSLQGISCLYKAICIFIWAKDSVLGKVWLSFFFFLFLLDTWKRAKVKAMSEVDIVRVEPT